jgi:hypothetical protein
VARLLAPFEKRGYRAAFCDESLLTWRPPTPFEVTQARAQEAAAAAAEAEGARATDAMVE